MFCFGDVLLVCAQLAQILPRALAHEGISSRQGAKNAKPGVCLCVVAGDTPKFGCGFAHGKYFFIGNPEEP